MRPIRDRLQSALAPKYEVERELARGGMSYVFLARDVALDRLVVLKVLRPELATAREVERFARESRILARLTHPNILPVHTAGDADGLFYFITDYIEGATLRTRLASGPVPVRDALALGDDVLAALTAAHSRGVVHRDIKPDNILLAGGRALLADFGIARWHEAMTGEATATVTGTPAYMAPEQLRGESTAATDIYAVGLVLYEALTGVQWVVAPSAGRLRWQGVPRGVAAVLRRALEPAPGRRWPDAQRFRAALQGAHRQSQRAAALVAAVAGVLFAAFAVWRAAAPTAPAEYELTMVPFTIGPGVPGEYAEHLPILVAERLGGVEGLVVNRRHGSTFRAWSRDLAHQPADRVAAALKTRHFAAGELNDRGGRIEARVSLYDATGRALPAIRIEVGDDYVDVADAVAFELLRRLRPGLAGSYRPVETLSRHPGALAEWLRGEAAVSRNEWRLAQQHFEAALQLDPTFVLAGARLDEVRIWLPWEQRATPVDLRGLFERHGERLHALDRLIIEGRLLPRGAARLRAYEHARNTYPLDAHAATYYADELFHRGPLLGRGLAESVDAFRAAIALDSSFGPAYEHMAWALIRLGDDAAAAHAIARYAALTPQAEYGSLHSPRIFEAAHALRFVPDDTEHVVAALVEYASEFDYVLRLGVGFDAPDAQRRLGLALARNASPAIRARGHRAAGIALLSMGRVTEALAHLDSVARLAASAEASLQRAEWRVLPTALAWPQSAVPGDDAAAALAELRLAAQQPPTFVRATWGLGLAALARGDSVELHRQRGALRASTSEDSVALRLATLLDALADGRAGRYAQALSATEPLLAYVADEQLGHAFARAALYLARGDWFERTGDLAAAERSLLWYEHSDINDLAGEIRPVEVDWIFGAYASSRRAALALRDGDMYAGCAHLERARMLWQHADAALTALLNDSRVVPPAACAS